jgi:hypothetical protein
MENADFLRSAPFCQKVYILVHTTTDKRKEIYLNAFLRFKVKSSPTIGCVIFENIFIINVKINR